VRIDQGCVIERWTIKIMIDNMSQRRCRCEVCKKLWLTTMSPGE